jgi:hypothetical protein
MRAGGPMLWKWDKEFWMIALDTFSIKSFGMTQLFIHISEKKEIKLLGNLRSSKRTLPSHVEIHVSA